MSTAFHPRIDGQTEWMNTWIKRYLRLWTASQPANWSKMLPVAEFAHNSWRHDVTHKSPHKLLIGIKPQVVLQHLELTVPATETRLKILDDARQSAQNALERVQQRKDNRKTVMYKEGDQVWLKAQNLMTKGNKKLSPKRYSPYQIIKQINPMCFRLDLPTEIKIHDIFHTDLLLPYKEMTAYSPAFTRPPPVIEKEEEYEVKTILDVRQRK